MKAAVATDPTFEDSCARACADYDSLPTLCLTLAQAQRLWALDEAACRRVLETLVSRGVLRIGADGQYCRADYACERP